MIERLNDSYLDAIDDPVEQAIEAGAQPPPHPGRRPPDFFLPRRASRLMDAMGIRIIGPVDPESLETSE